MAFPALLQTGFVDETAAARVERVKQERGVFWEPFAKVTAEAAKWSSSQVWTAFQYGSSFNKRNSAHITDENRSEYGSWPDRISKYQIELAMYNSPALW